MKKKTIIQIVLFVTILFFAGAELIIKNNSLYKNHLSIDCSLDEIKFGKEKGNLIDEVVFNEISLPYDAGTGTFFFSKPEGVKDWNNPTVKIVSDQNCKVVFERTFTEEDIRNDAKICFVVYTEDVYQECYLKCTSLPFIRLECYEDIEDDYVPVKIALLDNRKDAAQEYIESEGKIHIRGASSRLCEKKNYRLSLSTESLGNHDRKNKISLLGMRQDEDWILFAPYDDTYKLDNVFSTNLWYDTCSMNNAFGVNTGVEYRWIEVFLNNTYWGLYALGYPLDEKVVEIDENTGGLYKKVDWSLGNTLTNYENKGQNEDDWSYLEDFFQFMEENKNDNAKLRTWIDIDNAIDFSLFVNLVQAYDLVGYYRQEMEQSDSYTKNLYIAVKEHDGNKTALYCPWDLDDTWAPNPEENAIMASGYLDQLLINGDIDLIYKICDRYGYLRQNQWSDESFQSRLDREEQQIFWSGAAQRDKDRWPDSEWNPEMEQGLRVFKDYVFARLEETDRYYERIKQHAQEGYYMYYVQQFEGFLDKDFVIKVNREVVNNNQDLRVLLEYLSVDISRLSEATTYISRRNQEDALQYYSEEDIENSSISDLLPEGISSFKENSFDIIMIDGAVTKALNLRIDL